MTHQQVQHSTMVCSAQNVFFFVYLRTNSDFCPMQLKMIGLYNRDEKCLQRGTDWVFKYSCLRFVGKGLSSSNGPWGCAIVTHTFPYIAHIIPRISASWLPFCHSSIRKPLTGTIWRFHLNTPLIFSTKSKVLWYRFSLSLLFLHFIVVHSLHF